MSRALIFGILAFVFTATAFADDLVTRDGKIYKNYKVTSHDADSITILYEDGGGQILLTDLPDPLQKQYGYDPEKAAAALKAQQDADAKAAADQKAEQAQQQKEQADALQKLKDLTMQALDAYQTYDKIPITGQVFIATQGGENVKLGAIHVYLYSEPQANQAISILLARANQEQKALEPILAQQRATCISLIGSAGGSDGPQSNGDGSTSTSLDDAKKAYTTSLVQYYSYLTDDYFINGMPDPIIATTSDADGKFTINFPKGGSWVLFAQGQRAVFDKTEYYLWATKVDPNDVATNSVFLNNDNLSDVNSSKSLINALTPDDVVTLVEDKIDSLTQSTTSQN